MNPQPRRHRSRTLTPGFTLLEVVLVMVIIGVLATVAALNLTAGADKARESATRASLKTIEQALKQYYFEKGAYPTTAEGIPALVAAKHLDKPPQDGWKRDFLYFSPVQADPPFDLYSMGKDAIDGNADDMHLRDVK